MGSKNANRQKIILSCGEAACLSGRVITPDLLSLQMLTRLKKLGFVFSGNVHVCRFLCTRQQESGIEKRAGKENDLIILSSEDGGERQVRRRVGKKKIRLRKLICACDSDALFFLIDMKLEGFEILSPAEAHQYTQEKYEKALKEKN